MHEQSLRGLLLLYPISFPDKMAEEIEYKLEPVKATSVAADQIDAAFRSNCIGELGPLPPARLQAIHGLTCRP